MHVRLHIDAYIDYCKGELVYSIIHGKPSVAGRYYIVRLVPGCARSSK